MCNRNLDRRSRIDFTVAPLQTEHRTVTLSQQRSHTRALSNHMQNMKKIN